MINTTRFKKILHILKQNTDDLNINICIIDYDVSQECDYEQITLYLKETNTQNGAVVYKDFIIRSQLYYDVENDKYMSALDGDILIRSETPTRIDILTDITEDSLKNVDNQIKVKLVNAENNEALYNQSIFMYSSDKLDEPVASATTNKQGEAVFNFYLSTPIFANEQKIFYFEYLGNTTYRKSKSDYVLVNLQGHQLDDMTSTIDECININGKVRITYEISLDNTNIVDAFPTELVDESDLLSGKVLFYLHNNQDNLFLGSSNIKKIDNKTISTIDVVLPQEYRNTDITIQAIFEGNTFFASNSATKATKIFTTAPNNIELSVDEISDGFKTKLSFDVPVVSGNTLCAEDDGFNILYHTYGDIKFYLKNNQNEWGTLSKFTPFYISDNYTAELQNGVYSVSTETQLIEINLDDYGLSANDIIYVKAIYSGNAIVDGFEIEANNISSGD